MEYCMIALNEASNLSLSNKFDLAACQGIFWVLGVKYELPKDVEAFSEDIRSKLWITYRKNFPPLDDDAHYTTDTGFGCMIRCGQMVLSNALIYKHLGRNWRWSSIGLELNPEIYTNLLRLFQDKPECLYSIHRIAKVGELEGKVIGDWFGPNTIAQAMKHIVSLKQEDEDQADLDSLLSIHIALDNILIKDEVCCAFKRQDTNEWLPGILFIQLRLGLSSINPLYVPALKKTFQFKNSLGIIGGRPNHALYLVGCTEDDVIYLDPHTTQQFTDLDKEYLDDRENQEAKLIPRDSTYHCSNPEKMSIDRLDPSLALCFYLETEQDFEDWCKLSNDTLLNQNQAPMFEIVDTRQKDWDILARTAQSRKSFAHKQVVVAHSNSVQLPSAPQSGDEGDEFEMLG